MAKRKKNNIMGISALPSEWSSDDDKAVMLWMNDLAKKKNWLGRTEDWPLYDDYLSKCMELRDLAKRMVAETGKPVAGIWGQIKKRAIQEQEGVLHGIFPLSDWYDRKFRTSYAIAGFAHPDDASKRHALAKVIFLEDSDSRTEAAWEAAHYTQLSLFHEVDEHAIESPLLYEVLADPTPSGADPGEAVQLSFLDAVLDAAGLSERTKDVAEMLADGYRPAEIARRLVPPISHQTVVREMDKIAEFHHGWLNDIPFGVFPEEVMDDG